MISRGGQLNKRISAKKGTQYGMTEYWIRTINGHGVIYTGEVKKAIA